MGCKITKIATYLPEKVLTNTELEQASARLSAAKIEKKVGIRERHIAGAHETSLDMAYHASLNVLSGYDKDKIDFVILCTQSPDYFLPTSASMLQNKLGLRTNIGAFDMNLGCSGYIYGLACAKSFIAANLASTVLVVTSETYSKFIHEKDYANRTIFGDGATATIIEKADNEAIFQFVLGTDGSGWDKLIVPNGGMRNAYDPLAPQLEDDSGNCRTNNHIYMNGPEIFNFTIEAVPPLIEETLLKNQMEKENIDYFIFHQANKYMIEYLQKKIKIPDEKFYKDMLHVGNTVSSTIPIALKESLDKGLVKTGNKVLLCGFGVGYSWGAVIIEI